MSAPIELIPLYIRGAVVPTSVGTTMYMAPLGTAPEKVVTVEVQGISFLISRDMVLDTKEYKYGIPMQGNYFAKALFNQPERDTIVIENRADTLGEAKFYPVIFDFLRRRSESSAHYLPGAAARIRHGHPRCRPCAQARGRAVHGGS